MKWFYIISAIVVIGLTSCPLWLLGRQAGQEQYKGKVVTYNTYGAKVKSCDSATSHDTTSAGIQGYVYEALYEYHYLKRPPTVIPCLAADLPDVSKDNLTYTIRLKKGIKYAPNKCFGVDEKGNPKTRTVKAQDFVLAFKRIADSHITSPAFGEVADSIKGIIQYYKQTRSYHKGDFSRYDKETIEGIVALDEHTLQIKLNKVYPQLRYVLAKRNYAPFPREVLEYYLKTEEGPQGKRVPVAMDERDPELRTHLGAVGTGPYIWTEWVKANKIVLERNPNYRDVFYPSEGEPGDAEAGLLEDAGKKIPFIDVRHMKYVGEDFPAWMLFATQQRDTAGIPADVFGTVINPEKQLSENWQKKNIRLEKYTYPAIYFIAFNMDGKIVGKSKALRQALNLAFDVDLYIDVLYNGRGTRALTYAPQTLKGVAEAGPCPYSRLDVEEARRKYQQAREELDAAGILGKDEQLTLAIEMPGQDIRIREMGEFIQQQLEGNLDLKIKIEQNDWPTLQKKVNKGQFQMYVMGGVASIPDADDFLQSFVSKNIERGLNDIKFRNAEFDKLYEKSQKIADDDQRADLYAKMLKILNEECPYILLLEPMAFQLLHPWVHNFKPNPMGYGMGKYTRIDVEARHKAGGQP